MAFGKNSLTILIKARDQASAVLKQVQDKVEAHGAAFEKAGRRMLLASGALTAGLGLSIKQAASFQQSMAQVSTMLDQQSMKQMPAYTKAIKRMSMEYGEGTKVLADGLYNILSASVPANEAINVLDVSVKAAKAGLTDTGVAADAITTILNSYGLEASKAADVSDFLFTIVKRGKLTFADLAPNIGKVSAMASNAGISLENLGATIATLTRAGLRTEMAMTAVRGIVNAMQKPADEAAAAFEDKLGVAMNTTTLRAEGVIGVLKRMKDAGLKPEEIAEMFPNIRALSGIVGAMGDLEGITYDYNLMVNRAGAAQEAFGKNISTTQVQMKRFKETLNVILIGLGDGLLPVTNKVLGAFVKLGKWFNDLSPVTKKMVAVTTALVAALLAVAGVITLLIAKLPMLMVGVIALKGAFAGATAGAIAFNTALTVGSIGAIVGVGAVLTKLTSQLYDYMSAKIEAAEAERTTENNKRMAFAKSLQFMNKNREEMANMNDAVREQAEEVDKLIEGWRIISGDPSFSMEDRLEAEEIVTEAVFKLMSLRRQALEERRQAAAEERTMQEEKAESIDTLTALEKEAYARLNNDILMMDMDRYNKEKIMARREYKERVKRMKAEIKDEQKQKLFLAKLDDWYAKRVMQIDTVVAREKRTKAIRIAQITIDTLQAILEAEGSSAKKKKALIIALMSAELALGITRMWSAEATKGVLGIPLAIAGTAALVANYGVQMHNLTKGSSEISIGKTPDLERMTGSSDLNINSNTGVTPSSSVDFGSDADGGTVVSSGGGASSGVGGGGGVSNITTINVGGVDVNLGNVNVEENNLESVMRDIGEAVKAKTVEGVTMALQIYETGKTADIEEEAV